MISFEVSMLLLFGKFKNRISTGVSYPLTLFQEPYAIFLSFICLIASYPLIGKPYGGLPPYLFIKRAVL